MADGEVEYLIQAQMKRATALVNEWARTVGVNYRRWPGVTETMQESQIDAIELSAYLADAAVVEVMRMLGVTRYPAGKRRSSGAHCQRHGVNLAGHHDD